MQGSFAISGAQPSPSSSPWFIAPSLLLLPADVPPLPLSHTRRSLRPRSISFVSKRPFPPRSFREGGQCGRVQYQGVLCMGALAAFGANCLKPGTFPVRPPVKSKSRSDADSDCGAVRLHSTPTTRCSSDLAFLDAHAHAHAHATGRRPLTVQSGRGSKVGYMPCRATSRPFGYLVSGNICRAAWLCGGRRRPASEQGFSQRPCLCW